METFQNNADVIAHIGSSIRHNTAMIAHVAKELGIAVSELTS
jgi:hypothetical protein